MLLTCSIFAVSINQSSNGMKSYNKKFVYFICLVSAMGGLLFGYDWVVIGGAKPFYELYFDIADVPAMQGLAMSVALLGCLIGAMVAGMMADRYGRKPLLIISAFIFLSSAYATGAFSAFSWFLAARFLGGIGIGIASGLSPMYIAEVAPTSIRGKLVSLNQLTIVLGILGAQITNWLIAEPIPADFSPVDICASWNGQMGWRWMFWAAAFPAAIFLLLACFIPESPRWLAMKGKEEKRNGSPSMKKNSKQEKWQMTYNEKMYLMKLKQSTRICCLHLRQKRRKRVQSWRNNIVNNEFLQRRCCPMNWQNLDHKWQS